MSSRSTAKALVASSALLLPAVLPAQAADFRTAVQPFLEQHCFSCHGKKTQKADFAVHDLAGDLARGDELDRWEKIREMLALGLMPPEKRKQPEREDVDQVVRWIDAKLTSVGREPLADRLDLPKYGNRVRHTDLFSEKHDGPAFSYSRLWRISPSIYAQMAGDLGIQRLRGFLGQADTMADALATVDGKGFQDFSLLRADEATLRLLVTSSRTLAAHLTESRVIRQRKSGRKQTKFARQGFRLSMLRSETASDADLRDALDRAFDKFLQRSPSAEERQRYGAFLAESVKVGGPLLGFQNLLMAIQLSPEFLFRMEIGLGEKLPDGRRMLAPQEIAYALAFALGDRPPDRELRQAARDGRLKTRADVEREARRLLKLHRDAFTFFTVPMQAAGSKSPAYHPRLLRFFREFFGYHRAPAVFKDDAHRSGRLHDPQKLVQDADRFVLGILAKDRDVFGQLLTSDAYFVEYLSPKKLMQAKRKAGRRKGRGKKNRGKKNRDSQAGPADLPPRKLSGYARAYNLEEGDLTWETEQPVRLPNRAGMLTHPAWLVAHSGNFDTDPIRRGKWIREHLLAGNVPDLPIGVEAKVPEDPHKTLRQRMKVTEARECWRCHKYMNPLGLPFEHYDDFGWFREQIVLVKERRKRKRVLTPERTAPIDATGELRGTGDRALDGKVDGALDLIQRLAKSERVRQSFVRHAFRFFMGRNERLTDAPTLRRMDRAYVASDGSFQELLIALLTSDSFLLRKDRTLQPK